MFNAATCKLQPPLTSEIRKTDLLSTDFILQSHRPEPVGSGYGVSRRIVFKFFSTLGI